MLIRLLLLFTIVPLIELTLLLQLADWKGWWLTVCLVFGTGIVGAMLARYQGLRCMNRVQEELSAGRLPGDPMIDGLMILVAGALLVTPGILTDLVGFALLTPIFRSWMRRYLKHRFEARIRVVSAQHGSTAPRDQVIDVHVIEADSEDVEEEKG